VFNFLRDPKKKTIEAAVKQGIGLQSVLYRRLQETFGLSDHQIDKIEITFFVVSLIIVCIFMADKRGHAAELADKFTLELIRKSLPQSGSTQTEREAVLAYQQRGKDYWEGFDRVLSQKKVPDGKLNPATALVWNLYSHVARNLPPDHSAPMLEFAMMVPYVLDAMDDALDLLKR
jgi:hypothetical protein